MWIILMTSGHMYMAFLSKTVSSHDVHNFHAIQEVSKLIPDSCILPRISYINKLFNEAKRNDWWPVFLFWSALHFCAACLQFFINKTPRFSAYLHLYFSYIFLIYI